MKAAIFSLLLAATAFANAAVDCDESKLTSIANSDDASSCQLASNFVVPVESTASIILTDLESFCADASCERVLDALHGVGECSIEGLDLHQSIVGPIKAVCRATRALRAADESHAHGSMMEMSSGSAEMEDSHDATSPSTTTESSEVEDSHDTASSTSGSIAAGDDDDHDSHDAVSSTATSSTGSKATSNKTTTSTAGSSTGDANAVSKATSSNSTSSTQAPNASSTSSAGSISVALGSIILAAAAAFF